MCFVYKKGDYQLTRYTKEKYNKAREGFKRYIHQYLADNNFNNNFNKDIIAIVLNILTPSSNFFYNNYSIKYFIILNRLILIKTAKNIVIFINNNTFTYSLTSSIEPNIEPSIVRRNNISNKSSNNKGKSTTYLYNNKDPPNLTININFLNYYFNNNRQDYRYLVNTLVIPYIRLPISTIISAISIVISVISIIISAISIIFIIPKISIITTLSTY